MTNAEKYMETFITLFGVTKNELQKLEYQGVDTWDSVGHMSLVARLEETFDIMMETDDIIEFSSFLKGIEILRKYGVRL